MTCVLVKFNGRGKNKHTHTHPLNQSYFGSDYRAQKQKVLVENSPLLENMHQTESTLKV